MTRPTHPADAALTHRGVGNQDPGCTHTPPGDAPCFECVFGGEE